MFHKNYGDTQMVGIETKKKIYKVVIMVSSEAVNIAAYIRHKPWPERVGHCGSTIQREALCTFRELTYNKFERNWSHSTMHFWRVSTCIEKKMVMDKQYKNQLGGYIQKRLVL